MRDLYLQGLVLYFIYIMNELERDKRWKMRER